VGALANELSQESDLLTVDRLPAIAPRFRFRHNRPMPAKKLDDAVGVNMDMVKPPAN
jgi:hypothetical protein